MIKGLRPVSLVDYPGEVCSTVFTGGCNFNCTWCHNRDLVDNTGSVLKDQTLREHDVVEYLKRRMDRVPAVCITGGEPTLWGSQLLSFLSVLKQAGMKIKLDTNGSNPAFLREIYSLGLVDFVAMDLKNSPERYAMTAGKEDLEMRHVLESVELIKHSRVPYQFRTTVVPGLVNTADVSEFADTLGVDVVFQEYRHPRSNHRFI